MARIAQHDRPPAVLRTSLKQFDECGFADKPWLILGKGPSYSKIASIDLARYNVLAINHVVERLDGCEIAHMADWETFLACAGAAESRARYICIPYYPFVAFAPSSMSIDQLAESSSILRRLIGAGRILTYNLVCTSQRGTLEGFPDVHLSHFSAEAVIDYLGKSGASKLTSLGVDGGASYAVAFENLVGTTLLASGQPTYDLQFDGIASALLRSDVHYSPLDIRSPILVNIVHEPGHDLAARVLAYSIRRHSPLRMEIAFERRNNASGAPAGRHHGIRLRRAAHNLIELDARSLVLGNLLPLLRRMFADTAIVPREVAYVPRRTSLTSRHLWWLERFLKPRLAMFERSSDMPWKNAQAPHHDAWMTALREAIYWRCVSIRHVRSEIACGNVSPGIFKVMSQGPQASHG